MLAFIIPILSVFFLYQKRNTKQSNQTKDRLFFPIKIFQITISIDQLQKNNTFVFYSSIIKKRETKSISPHGAYSESSVKICSLLPSLQTSQKMKLQFKMQLTPKKKNQIQVFLLVPNYGNDLILLSSKAMNQ